MDRVTNTLFGHSIHLRQPAMSRAARKQATRRSKKCTTLAQLSSENVSRREPGHGVHDGSGGKWCLAWGEE